MAWIRTACICWRGMRKVSPSAQPACKNGKIVRMAVLKPWRGRGVGRALLRELLAEAQRRGLSQVYLAAQTQAIGFYQQHGFQMNGDVFLDAGIPHQNLILKLPTQP